ncbi:hypothetical protein MKJ01_00835 [Chryseobacterium sp. SSA4.19]|uniref:hypothetical protein n=1 Tax=Chryseobacterium sp. SSA4.19 TaxID=2919915 RepID=UPI001F4EFB86|nr:hypothetical protein [Chryseobacterium sp. SSA4.19]MCJ8152302.1 hypothetical protein [Chryseobacterium sp. SSA4.19]
MIKKFTDTFFTFLGFVVIAALMIFIVFIENPVTYFLYAFLITLAVNFKNLKYLKSSFLYVIRKFSITLIVVYLVLIIVMSLSPFLRIQEFKISHWNWKAIHPKEIKALPDWDSGYKRMGNSYVDIQYEYQSGGKLYKNKESEVLKKYYPFWNGTEHDKLVSEFSKSVSEKIEQKDFIAFYTPEHPQKSKFFLSTDLFYFQGSLFYNFVTSFVMVIMGIAGLVLLIILSQIKKSK